jgi:hypothetical protein
MILAMQVFEVLFPLFNYWIRNVWIGDSNKNDCPAGVVWKVNAFTSLSSAHTKQNCSIF